ncbi:MAG TPA: hypothetical protein VLA46_00565 [Saprospiraceae bacterium]|nr:hypothetical protein [Saprospiraceae bacterium]
MKKSWIVIGFLTGIMLTVGTSCGDKPKSLNPNGDSELALLMREMHTDGMKTKQQLLDGKTPDISVKYEKLFTAKATEPAKVATPEYTAYATIYETAVKNFLERRGNNQVEAYTTMVDACMNCHQQICPGPMVKIKKLYLSEKEMASVGL